MNENKTCAKNLTAGMWIMTEFGINVVECVNDYGNGWLSIDLSDGHMIDCLAYRTFQTV